MHRMQESFSFLCVRAMSSVGRLVEDPISGASQMEEDCWGVCERRRVCAGVGAEDQSKTTHAIMMAEDQFKPLVLVLWPRISTQHSSVILRQISIHITRRCSFGRR